MDDVRVLMPEVQRVLQEIVPMVDDVSVEGYREVASLSLSLSLSLFFF